MVFAVHWKPEALLKSLQLSRVTSTPLLLVNVSHIA